MAPPRPQRRQEQEQETTVVVARSTIVEYQGFAHNSVMRCSVLQILLGSGMTGLSLCGLILVAMGDARRDYRIWDGLLVGLIGILASKTKKDCYIILLLLGSMVDLVLVWGFAFYEAIQAVEDKQMVIHYFGTEKPNMTETEFTYWNSTRNEQGVAVNETHFYATEMLSRGAETLLNQALVMLCFVSGIIAAILIVLTCRVVCCCRCCDFGTHRRKTVIEGPQTIVRYDAAECSDEESPGGALSHQQQNVPTAPPAEQLSQPTENGGNPPPYAEYPANEPPPPYSKVVGPCHNKI